MGGPLVDGTFEMDDGISAESKAWLRVGGACLDPFGQLAFVLVGVEGSNRSGH